MTPHPRSGERLRPPHDRTPAELPADRPPDSPGAARDRLVLDNLRLVIAIAPPYRGLGLDWDDLIGEGNLGLLRAAASFDPGRGLRFSTHAAYWIKTAIRDALTNTSRTIRIPAGTATLLRRWNRADRRPAGEGPGASFEEVADRAGLTEGERERVRLARIARRGTVDASSHAAPGFVRERERAEEAAELQRRVESRLSAQEREVLGLRFGLGPGGPMTRRAIGDRLALTRESVAKIEAKSLAKLSR